MYRLGKLRSNPADLSAAHVHTFGASIAPAVLDRHAVDFTPCLDGNDRLSNCTVVSVANMIRGRAALNGYHAYVDTAKVIEFFLAAAGNPPDPSTIEGLIYLNVINRQATLGFDTGHDKLYGIPGTVGISRNSLAVAMNELGSVGMGIILKQKDMPTAIPTPVLDIGPNDGVEVGGHAVIGFDYTGLGDLDTVRMGTWGYWQNVTWRWLESRIDEAHGISWPQLKAASCVS
jgi:hypothetical protein